MSHQEPSSRPFEGWPRPLAFVLSGGGAFGPVQVGMLRALQEHGVRPDLIVGTSVGALNGALLAAEGDAAVDRLTDLWRTMHRRAVFGGRRDLVRSLARTRSLAGPERLTTLIDTHLGVATFEDLTVPFAAVATDAMNGEPELLATGPLRSALLASAAVPGVFPSVERDGRRYVDGGVAANVPIRQAIAFGARSIVSLDATPAQIADTVPTSFTGAVLHSMSLMLRNQRSHAVDELAHRYPIATLPSATPPNMGTFNFDRTEELLTTSYERASEALRAWAADDPAGTTSTAAP